MLKSFYSFSQWPRENSGAPIFDSSKAAIFYAHLITDNSSERAKIAKLRQKVGSELILMRASDHPNIQRMFNLSVKGQLYRECLEESGRIKKEVPKDAKA